MNHEYKKISVDIFALMLHFLLLLRVFGVVTYDSRRIAAAFSETTETVFLEKVPTKIGRCHL